MNIKSLLSVTLLSLGLAMAAQADIVSMAYEVALGDFRAPTTPNGSAAFKPCSDCETKLVRVTAHTRYEINGKAVKFLDFRKTVREAGDRAEKTVIVLHHIESDTIKSLDVSL